MAYRNWANQDYHCHIPISPEDCYDYQTYDGLVDPPSFDREYEPRNGQVHSVRRYLDDPDRPLLVAYTSEMEGTFVPSWSGYPLPPLDCVDSHYTPYDHHSGRVASPGSNSVSGSSTSYVSSNLGEGPEPSSWSSPEVAMIDHMPAYGYDHVPRIKREESLSGGYGPCVALHDVQTHADALPDDSIGFEDDGTAYTGYLGYMDAEDGYQPLETTCEHSDMEFNIVVYQSSPETIKSEISTPPGSPEALSSRYRDVTSSPNIRRRRAPSAMTASTNSSNHRVNKRRSVASKYVDEPTTSRAFPCSLAAYGCTSTFGSKNEWKRHINTQHMRLDFWRCDQCPPTRSSSSHANLSTAFGNKKFNDFNRKDLFIQHIRRMHPHSILPVPPTSDPVATTKVGKAGRANGSSSRIATAQQTAQAARAQDAALVQIAARCRRRTRSPPPESGCLFCSARFCGEDTWDERLEHIGRHFECARKSNSNNNVKREHDEEEAWDDDKEEQNGDVIEGTDPRRWRRDALVEEWMLKEGIVVRAGGRGKGCVLAT